MDVDAPFGPMRFRARVRDREVDPSIALCRPLPDPRPRGYLLQDSLAFINIASMLRSPFTRFHASRILSPFFGDSFSLRMEIAL